VPAYPPRPAPAPAIAPYPGLGAAAPAAPPPPSSTSLNYPPSPYPGGPAQPRAAATATFAPPAATPPPPRPPGAPPSATEVGLRAESSSAGDAAAFDDAPTRILNTDAPAEAAPVPLFDDEDLKTNVWRSAQPETPAKPLHHGAPGVSELQPPRRRDAEQQPIIIADGLASQRARSASTPGAAAADGSRGLVMALSGALVVTILVLIAVAVRTTSAPKVAVAPPTPAAVATPGAASAAVFTQPAGARVTVDGRLEANATPLTLSGLEIGKEYEILIRMDGYREIRDRLSIKDTAPVQRAYSLEKLVASATVTTVPTGAKVTVDGVEAGLSPASVSGLDFGRTYSITASLPDRPAVTQSVTWSPGDAENKTIELRLGDPVAEMKPAAGTGAAPEATPAKAAVQRSPAREQAQPAARAPRAAQAAPAAPPAARPRDTRPSAPSAPPAPAPRPSASAAPAAPTGAGTLSVQAIPYGQVWVDGRMVSAETPLRNHSLPAGEHRVKVYFVSLRTFSDERSVRIEPGQPSTLTFRAPR
jgi:hypothetical protein